MSGGSENAIWQILYFGGAITIGGVEDPNLLILYSIIPWIGVMAAGCAFGSVLRMPAGRRDRMCYTIGGAAIALFLPLRYFHGSSYSDACRCSTTCFTSR